MYLVKVQSRLPLSFSCMIGHHTLVSETRLIQITHLMMRDEGRCQMGKRKRECIVALPFSNCLLLSKTLLYNHNIRRRLTLRSRKDVRSWRVRWSILPLRILIALNVCNNIKMYRLQYRDDLFFFS